MVMEKAHEREMRPNQKSISLIATWGGVGGEHRQTCTLVLIVKWISFRDSFECVSKMLIPHFTISTTNFPLWHNRYMPDILEEFF